MPLEQRLHLKQTLQLRMTPQLRQAIKILQVSRSELETIVTDELYQNPTLEEAETASDEAGEAESRTGDVEVSETEAPAAKVSETDADASDLRGVDWEEYLDRYGSDFHGSIGTGSDRDDNRTSFLENAAEKHDDLVSALTDQLHLVPMSEQEQQIGAVIIQNIDENGYLAAPPEEVAALAGCSLEALQEAREIIQEFEPPGCGSIDLRECLLVQLRLIGYEADDYVVQIVDQHLKDLEARRYDKLARSVGTTIDEVLACHKIIQNLEPKPGRNFDSGDTRYISPDVYIVREGDRFHVVLNDDGLPRLRVSDHYRRMVKRSGSRDAQSYLQEKLRSAQWLIRSIHQRQSTLLKVTKSIAEQQRGFLLNGVAHLRPMVLKDVANDIEMHESTVSRATANKYVHTPQGIFELKYFFTSSIRSTDGTDVSSESVKQKIQQIIGREDPRKPCSDQYIAEVLSRDHIDIARRTVAKYRELLGILPSSKRKRYLTGT